MEVTAGPTKEHHGRSQQVGVADRMTHPGVAPVKISIGIITRERPKLLTRLLDSLPVLGPYPLPRLYLTESLLIGRRENAA